MTEPIEESYFNWLCAKVARPGFIKYYDLMRILHKTEFVWVVHGDRNREADGLELRYYFLVETNLESEPRWYESPCSVLEVLIAFANRASFLTGIPVRDWFWTFLTNLNINEYIHISQEDELVIEEILYNFIWRLYGFDGDGGLFPIRSPTRNQKEIEIWYQFGDYLEDQGLI